MKYYMSLDGGGASGSGGSGDTDFSSAFSGVTSDFGEPTAADIAAAVAAADAATAGGIGDMGGGESDIGGDAGGSDQQIDIYNTPEEAPKSLEKPEEEKPQEERKRRRPTILTTEEDYLLAPQYGRKKTLLGE